MHSNQYSTIQISQPILYTRKNYRITMREFLNSVGTVNHDYDNCSGEIETLQTTTVRHT